mgnify:CR=1 FL=1
MLQFQLRLNNSRYVFFICTLKCKNSINMNIRSPSVHGSVLLPANRRSYVVVPDQILYTKEKCISAASSTLFGPVFVNIQSCIARPAPGKTRAYVTGQGSTLLHPLQLLLLFGVHYAAWYAVNNFRMCRIIYWLACLSDGLSSGFLFFQK